MRKISRMVKMLIELQQKRMSSEELAKCFGVSKRTIQRDIKILREARVPLKKDKNGQYTLDKNIMKDSDLCFDESELSFILGLRDLLSKMGKPFNAAARNILNLVSYDNLESIIFIGMNQSIHINDKINKIFNKIIQAIYFKNLIDITYSKISVDQTYTVEPYKLAWFEGFWYLIAKDLSSKVIKKYAVDKIKNVKLLKRYFKKIPQDLDDILKNSANVWFSSRKNITVRILVDEECAPYFKRKILFPTQKIEKVDEYGNIIVSFQIGRYEEIINFLKSWLPCIKILEPEDLKEEIVEQMKEWLEWQEEQEK